MSVVTYRNDEGNPVNAVRSTCLVCNWTRMGIHASCPRCDDEVCWACGARWHEAEGREQRVHDPGCAAMPTTLWREIEVKLRPISVSRETEEPPLCAPGRPIID